MKLFPKTSINCNDVPNRLDKMWKVKWTTAGVEITCELYKFSAQFCSSVKGTMGDFRRDFSPPIMIHEQPAAVHPTKARTRAASDQTAKAPRFTSSNARRS